MEPVLRKHFEQMSAWCLRPNGRPDTAFDGDGLFVFPGQGRAVQLLRDGEGVLVGGYHFSAPSGSDVTLLRLAP